MRKKTINHLADTIFWYLIYFLPVICYLLFLIAEPSSGGVAVNMETFFNSIGISLTNDNIVLATLSQIFGSNGILPLFGSTVPLVILSWFVSVYLAHLLVDILLFIPRLFHKYEKSFTQGD